MVAENVKWYVSHSSLVDSNHVVWCREPRLPICGLYLSLDIAVCMSGEQWSLLHMFFKHLHFSNTFFQMQQVHYCLQESVGLSFKKGCRRWVCKSFDLKLHYFTAVVDFRYWGKFSCQRWLSWTMHSLTIFWHGLEQFFHGIWTWFAERVGLSPNGTPGTALEPSDPHSTVHLTSQTSEKHKIVKTHFWGENDTP